MNIQKIPLVTSLLQASKNEDVTKLNEILCEILKHGISKCDLNLVDQNGRTALSYVCTSQLTQVLDVLLHIPGIDVNKADNEGNTPLHFAAEAGKSAIITMLTTRSRSLAIDAKNKFGLTPLMKAAVQGRVDCAKLLLLANASPVETDTKRGYRADQWAYFCGRPLCGENISQIARFRSLGKTSSFKLPSDYYEKKVAVRSSSALISLNKTAQTPGLITKLRRTLPVLFKPSKFNSECDLPDLVASFTDVKVDKHCNGSDNTVPIVEVTPANNQKLIEKYKIRYNSNSTTDSKVEQQSPAVPPRRKSFNM